MIILKSGSMGQLLRVADGSSGTEARHELGSVSEYLYLIRGYSFSNHELFTKSLLSIEAL